MKRIIRHPFIQFFLRFRFIRFGLVGVFNTILDGAIYFLLLSLFGTGYKVFFIETDTWARAIAMFVGVTSAFFMNSRLVFKDNGYHNDFHEEITFSEKLAVVGRSYTKFIASYAMGMGMNLLTYTTMKRLHIDSFPPEMGLGLFSKLPAFIVSTGVSAVFNYFFCKHFVFKPKAV
ncbi:GtrA family protein [Cytophagaceae bacterium DM2B3-1]|uniref:GtrA family protein n=1 Tax=Xanthocytophaga flava TaxID=3048013 RepID=A0ABT7CLT7_9BACT|nr:GtrA family protein [Xanthocytophaga flavus]MDJ1467628.1 GtrA family protein [Xanthocytophaga flavus]MDJ1494718.1 GtrA family protein [Xanthocytophaga flavus]